jgi:hypothetical protein
MSFFEQHGKVSMVTFLRNTSFGWMKLVLTIEPTNEMQVGQVWAEHVYDGLPLSVGSATLSFLPLPVMELLLLTYSKALLTKKSLYLFSKTLFVPFLQ